MKKYFTLIIFTLLFFSSDVFAQWYIQYQSTGVIYDVRFINKNTGWACGGGMILKTIDAGKNWIQQNLPATLMQIHPVNDTVVYACGFYVIYKTTDGGSNWITLREGPDQVPILYGLWFNNENTGWFCGDRVALRTTDGGQSFIDSQFVPNTLNDIHFKNDSVGVIGANSKTYRTTNSGANWYPVILPSVWESPFLNRVSFISDTGWTFSEGGIVYKTTNYGISWDSLTQVPISGRSIEFADSLIGYTGGYNGNIFKSTDGGNSWHIQNTNKFGPGPYGSINCFDDSVVWAVGGPGGGYIVNTTNGGGLIVRNEELIINELTEFELYQNYPNPFNPFTTISYNLIKKSFIILKIYNSNGQEISILVNQMQSSGEYKVLFDGSELSSGVYFYKLIVIVSNSMESKNFSETKKMLIIK